MQWSPSPYVWCLVQTEEEFFVCKWTLDEASGAPLLLLAGKNSVLRVLDVMQEKLLWVCLQARPQCLLLALTMH